MKLYLTLKSIPELSELPPEERQIAWHECRGKALRHWEAWAGTLAAMMLGIGVGVVTLEVTLAISPFSRSVTYFGSGFICGGVIVGVANFLRELVIASLVRPYLKAYLEERKREQEQEAEKSRISVDYLEAPFKEPEARP